MINVLVLYRQLLHPLSSLLTPSFFYDLFQFHPSKNTSTPSIVCYNVLSNKLISSNPGQNLGPYQPINSSRTKDCNSYNTMEVIWQTRIHILSIIRWNKWCNDKIYIRQEEEQHHRPSSTERRSPMLRMTIS